MSGDGEPTGGEDSPPDVGEEAAEQPTTDEQRSPWWRNGTLIFVLVVVAIAAVIAVVLAADLWNSDDDDNLVPVDSTTAAPSSSAAPTSSSAAPSTTEPVGATTSAPPPTTATASTTPATDAPPATSVPASTSPPTAPPSSSPALDDPLDAAVWPLPSSELRFTDPVEAARSFAVDYIGFVAPNFGEFQAGDQRSGEVELRIGEVGPTTVVFVRQLSDDDTWWVTGSATDNIVVQQPDALTSIDSPVVVTGLARAFEGTVNVELRADGSDEPLVEGFVTGSGGPDLGPFEETFEFENPGEGGGALVLVTFSADNGNVLEAEVVRLFFAAA
jgi:hypothetical protein